MNSAVPPDNAQASGSDDSLPTRRSLLSRLRDAGDDTSWRTFFETYWRLIYNMARKSGLADDAAQEVVQETVISVARKMPEFHYDPKVGSFKKWLLVITRRRIYDHLRRVYRSLPHAHFADGSRAKEEVASTPSPDAAMEEVWEEEWRHNIFQAALTRVRQRVNPKHYQVFDYNVLQNLRATDVGRMLGLNVAQVYLAKHRVIVALKRAAAEIETELQRSERFGASSRTYGGTSDAKSRAEL